jgi:hypothetical protein
VRLEEGVRQRDFVDLCAQSAITQERRDGAYPRERRVVGEFGIEVEEDRHVHLGAAR